MLILTFSTLYAQSDGIVSPARYFHIAAHAGYENNWWMPYITDKLSYTTEGFKIGYFNGEIRHGIKWLPDIRFGWETNFNSAHQNEILQVQNSKTNLEQGYDKIQSIFGFGRKIDHYLDENTQKMENGIEYQVFELNYTKETFFITVKPNVPDLRYAAYYSDNVYDFPRTASYSNYTKFQELSATFYTGHTSFIFAIFNGLLSPSQSSSKDFITFGKDVEVRFGGFYSTVRKPYEITQEVGYVGTTTGEINTIYNAYFKDYGVVEEIRAENFYISYKLGIATIDLKKTVELTDSFNPIFFSFGSKLGFTLPIKFSSRLGLNILGDFEYMFLYGSTMVNDNQNSSNQTSQSHLQVQSFINSDMLFKVTLNMYYNN
jgi:hypothetical protein